MTCKNTNAWKSWRSDSSRRNGATLWCRATNPADLLKIFVGWGLPNKRPSQFQVRPKSYRHQVARDTNVAHEIHTSVCDPDSEQFFRPALRGHGLPFRRISSKRSAYSRHTSYRWRYDHASRRDIYLVNRRPCQQGRYHSGANDHGYT